MIYYIRMLTLLPALGSLVRMKYKLSLAEYIEGNSLLLYVSRQTYKMYHGSVKGSPFLLYISLDEIY